MDYCITNFSYPSANGSDNIAAYIFRPLTGEYRGILQIVHGMSEHFMRYEPFCDFCAREGFIICGNDHLGHGETADCESALGYTAEKDGKDILASDVYKLSEIVKEEFPGLPHVMLGHSMGSLITRYCLSLYPDITDSAILMGTIGPGNPAKLGKAVANLNGKLFGEYNRSEFIKTVAFGPYLKHFSKDEGSTAWICSDRGVIEEASKDPRWGFTFTARGYYDLFDLLDVVNRRDWADKLPKDLPILLVSGRQDPCGDFGRGIVKVCEMLVGAGISGVRCKLYKNSRHEILNDVEKETVFSDLLTWIANICDRMREEGSVKTEAADTDA